MATIVPPRSRTCQRCGREDSWDEDAENWVVSDDSPGNPHCIHDWDINGTYNPIGEE